VTQHEPVPFRLQVLAYPVTDARALSASCETYRDGPWLTAEDMHCFVEHYVAGGRGSREDPLVSPLLGSDEHLASSPPTLVVTAELDPLRDEGEAYAERLRSLGVTVTVTRYEGMFHGFLSFADLLDDGRRALEQIASALADALRGRGVTIS
jgi:acetyl esterase